MDPTRERYEPPGDPIRASIEVYRGDQPGLAFEIDAPEFTIGKAPHNAIVLDDIFVSRLHARIVRQADGSHCLVDVGSKLGTFVDDLRAESNVPFRLGHAHAIRIGSYELIYRRYDCEICEGPEEERRFRRLSAEGDPALDVRARWDGGPDPGVRLLDVARILGRHAAPGRRFDGAIDELLDRIPKAAGGVLVVPRRGAAGRTYLVVAGVRHRAGPGGRLSCGARLARRALERAEAMLILEEPREIAFGDEQPLVRASRAWLGVPLLGMDGRPVGLLLLYGPPEPGAADLTFAVDDLKDLIGWSLPLGVAMDLHELERQRGDEVRRDIREGFPPPEPPRIPGYSFVGSSAWLDESEGWFVDSVRRIDRGGGPAPPRWAVLAGKASGPGLCAELVAGELRLEARRLVIEGMPVEQIASHLDRMIGAAEAQPGGTALLLAELDAEAHRLRVVSAGPCLPWIIRRRRGDPGEGIDPAILAPPLGLGTGAVHPAASHDLAPGDGLDLRIPPSDRDLGPRSPRPGRSLATITRHPPPRDGG